jgi:hypothetical protein
MKSLPRVEVSMVRIPVGWFPGLAAGFALNMFLSFRGILDSGLFSRCMSMVILLGCALAGKLLIEYVKRKRDARPSADFRRRMAHIDEFNRKVKDLKKGDGQECK